MMPMYDWIVFIWIVCMLPIWLLLLVEPFNEDTYL